MIYLIIFKYRWSVFLLIESYIFGYDHTEGIDPQTPQHEACVSLGVTGLHLPL